MKKSLLTTALTLGLVSAAHANEKNVLAAHVPGEVIIKLKSGMVKSFLARKSIYGAEVKEVLILHLLQTPRRILVLMLLRWC